MTEPRKIQGKFYPLKTDEWLESINELTHSELKILYYVRSLDPYNNGVNLTPAQIAKDLSTEKKKMHRSTVGRALKSLDKKGFINMELLQVRIKVNPKGFLVEEETESKNVVATQQCCGHTTQSAATQHRVRPHNTECGHTTQSAATQQSELETPTETESYAPKIYKTYKDFIQTLSEKERENFFNFVKERIDKFDPPINDLQAWLASTTKAGEQNFRVYYAIFQKEVPTEPNWVQHPKFKEWSAIFREAPGWLTTRAPEGTTPEELAERAQFRKWAWKNKQAVWGGEEI